MLNDEDIGTYLQQVVDEGTIPGAVLRVEHHGKLIYEVAIGQRHTDPPRPMQPDTLFDVASLTKVVATTGTLLQLFEEGTLSPANTLGDYLPLSAPKRSITLAQCLTHTSGLPAFAFLRHSITELDELTMEYEPGTRVLYSDAGFLALGWVIQEVTGRPLDEVVHEQTQRWNMPDTMYNPPDAIRCAATEWRENLGRYQVGEVHDENATVLGGVAGHAGLFSTARDLAVYAQLYLHAPGESWRARSHLDWTTGLDDRRGLGWQLWTPACFAGPTASPTSFGHTGFTGTSIWIDPSHDLVVVLLTNAVHYGRGRPIFAVRKAIHQMIYSLVEQ